MTPYELTYLFGQPFLPSLYWVMRSQLRQIAGSRGSRMQILDAGGRKSQYTIGMDADVTICEMPAETEIQKKYNLGLKRGVASEMYKRRSNLRAIVYGDMTQSPFSDDSFDCVLAVEVLEHIARDETFLDEVHRVLKPGGIFLMSTPNGDVVPNRNPDHKRHYSGERLHRLLNVRFRTAEVQHSVPGGIFHAWSLGSWSARHPMQTSKAMLGGFLNFLECTRMNGSGSSKCPQHLIGLAQKVR